MTPVFGTCPVCGWEPQRLHHDRIPAHFELRIGKNGQPYQAREWCDGRGQLPEGREPANPEPLGVLAPTFLPAGQVGRTARVTGRLT